MHPYKQTTEHTSKRASQQAGRAFNSEMPKEIHARQSINKSTERHPRVPYKQSAVEPSSGARDAQEAAQYFFRSETHVGILLYVSLHK